jgi:hypothetical protein
LEVKIIKVEPRITAASRELIATIVLDKQLDSWKNEPLDQGFYKAGDKDSFLF